MVWHLRRHRRELRIIMFHRIKATKIKDGWLVKVIFEEYFNTSSSKDVLEAIKAYGLKVRYKTKSSIEAGLE